MFLGYSTKNTYCSLQYPKKNPKTRFCPLVGNPLLDHPKDNSLFGFGLSREYVYIYIYLHIPLKVKLFVDPQVFLERFTSLRVVPSQFPFDASDSNPCSQVFFKKNKLHVSNERKAGCLFRVP